MIKHARARIKAIHESGQYRQLRLVEAGIRTGDDHEWEEIPEFCIK